MRPARCSPGCWPAPGPQGFTQAGIATHAARLRAVAGHELLLVPPVPVLPTSGAGRVLPARHAGHDDGRDVPGGAVDAGEPPAAAAVRKAREQISAGVRPVRLADVPGGPATRSAAPAATAPRTSSLSTRPGSSQIPQHPSDGELSELAWFTPGQQPGLQPSRFSRALLHAAGRL
jgi:ADP-ribose pyrophosphatase YjhB (NUDIX family)